MKTEKKIFYTELCYVLGIIVLALGTAFMEKADFGMSMVVAPAYLVYRKVSLTLTWFTFGMAEYTLQAVLLVVMMLVLRRFRVSFLFSFVTAVFYGVVLDCWVAAVGAIPFTGIPARLVYYVVGLLACAFGVALIFRTYIAPEVYELIVIQVSEKWGLDSSKCKTVYDLCSCCVSIVLSFIFFGFLHFIGVNVGTVVCAMVNGTTIGLFGKLLEKHFTFEDGIPALRRFFEK